MVCKISEVKLGSEGLNIDTAPPASEEEPKE